MRVSASHPPPTPPPQGGATHPKPVYVALRSTPDVALETLRTHLLGALCEIGLPCFQSANEAIRTFAELERMHGPGKRVAGRAI